MNPCAGPHDPLDALARSAAGGETDALEELIRRTHRRIFRWALVRVGDPDEADDVTQDVLLRLHRHLRAWRGESRFTSWLYRVTANVASSHRGRAGGGGGVESAPDAPAPTAEAADRLYADEVLRLVGRFFRELPARQREIFDLVDLQGHTPSEVAEMLEIHPGSVRASLFKARRTVRTRVLERYPELEAGWSP